MEKRFFDIEHMTSFVMRDIKKIEEPLITILKVLTINEDTDEVVLFNLQNGELEHTTSEKLFKDYQAITAEKLQKTFLFSFNTYGIQDQSFKNQLEN